MTTVRYQAGAATIAGLSPTAQFGLQITQTPLLLSGAGSPITNKDVTYIHSTSATYAPNFTMTVFPSGVLGGDVTITPLNGYAEVNRVGNVATVTRVADGVANILLSQGPDRRTITQDMTVVASALDVSISGYVAGSLLKYITDTVNGLVTAAGARTDANSAYLLSNNGIVGAGNDAAYNPSRWCKWDFSGSSIANAGGWDVHLVTPRHVVMSEHTSGRTGPYAVTFLDKNGVVRTLNIIDVIRPDNSVTGLPAMYAAGSKMPDDTLIAILDGDATNCTPYVMLPQNNTTGQALPTVGGAADVRWPMVWLHAGYYGDNNLRKKTLYTRDWAQQNFGYSYVSGDPLTSYVMVNPLCVDALKVPYTCPTIWMGSSSASFLPPLNGSAPVIMGLQHSPIIGPNLCGSRDVIQFCCDALSTAHSLSPASYQIQSPSFAGFNTYTYP